MSARSLFSFLFGNRVLGGPFRGLRYEENSVGSVLLAKLVGTYERELDEIVERIVARAPDVIVNAGAGEGYYAVGLATRVPDARVIAFETSQHGRDLIARLAARNRVVGRVSIHGLCTTESLRDALDRARSPVVVMDVEGAEMELLDLSLVPALARCPILVEIHDFVRPVGDTLARRFAGTHRLEEIQSRPRTIADLPPALRLLAPTPWRKKLFIAMDEERPGPMRWFWLEPVNS